MQKKQGKKEKEEVLVLIATVVAVVTLTRLITPALLLPAERSVMSPSLFFSVGGFGLNPLARFPARLPAAEQQQHFLFVSFFLRVTDFPPFSQATLYTSTVHLKND